MVTTTRWRIGAGAAVCLILLVIATSCSRGLGSQADDVFDRLASSVPWTLAEPAGYHGVCSTVVKRPMCGPFILRVQATNDEVLAGLPDVVRSLGFTKDVRIEGCDGCPQATTVLGEDEQGNELAISVYAEGGGVTALDTYLSGPPG